MTVTDLTVTGFVPMFVTLHSAWSGAKAIPVDIMVACAVDARMMPAMAGHTLRDIGLLLLVMVHVAGAPPEDASYSASGPTADHFLSSEIRSRKSRDEPGSMSHP